METKEYTTVDKSSWGEGAWQHEPDKVQFVDEATGLPCLIVRNFGGALCGYVGVPQTHPAYGKHYDDPECGGFDVHGGITFTGKCNPSEEASRSICHVVSPGEDDNVWWLGFDCAHAFDMTPANADWMATLGLPGDLGGGGEYRDIGYVKGEIARLAKQLAEVAP